MAKSMYVIFTFFFKDTHESNYQHVKELCLIYRLQQSTGCQPFCAKNTVCSNPQAKKNQQASKSKKVVQVRLDTNKRMS